MKFLSLILISMLTFPVIDMERRTFLDGKLELLVPKALKEMTKEDIKKEYTGDKPAFVLINDSATIKLSVIYNPGRLNMSEAEAFIMTKAAYKAGLEEGLPGSIWKDEGVKEIDGKKVWYAKIVHSADGKSLNHYIFLSYVRKRLYVCDFLCHENALPEWEETAEQIMNSFKVK